ncbi:helix-turn-helix domain-containing protein [Methylobacterium sp. C25]|uniref:helix-turn-helix domain-containing protein n=1 Tax=Methylobacterium sp. C25 TaxID=2721622 RepID=UPI001F478FE4|nr:helix-turn-helix domain-containing protein [Methylobacterium sp. C25]
MSALNGEDAYRGRKPSFTRDQFVAVRDALDKDFGVSAIATPTGLTRQTVYKIEVNPAEAEAALARWS